MIHGRPSGLLFLSSIEAWGLMSIAPLTELQAINQMLAAVGQAPVTSILYYDRFYRKNC